MIMAVAASPLLRNPASSTPEVTLENEIAADFQRAARSRRAFAPARVLIHAINYAPELIGCAKYTTELAEFLASRGHSVEVVTAPPHYPGWFVRESYRSWWYSRERMGQVAITRCPIVMKTNGGGIWRALAPLTFAICAAPMVVWRILRSRPDVVLCIEPTLFSSPAALFAAKMIGARAVLHVQDLEVDAAFEIGQIKGGLKKLAFALERRVLGAYDRIVTISEKMRAALLGKGLEAAQVEVLRNWVDLERIRPQPNRRANSYRGELAIAAGVFVVLYAGHIGAKQALHVVLDAARRLTNSPDILFVIAGEGPMKRPLAETYRDLTNVLYLPLQPPERLNDLLNLANLHVLPQARRAADLVLPSKLGGMLASGRPIVAATDANTELGDILKGIAVIVPAEDAEELAAAILAARREDLSAEVKRGLKLAGAMSSQTVLPLFEEALLDARSWTERQFEPDVAAAA